MKLVIEGGKPLRGAVQISGAKNAVLPLMAASLLMEEALVIDHVPLLNDVETMVQLLRSMGVEVQALTGRKMRLQANRLAHCFASYDIVSRMRASVLVLGPLLARFGRAKVALPGGCAIGSRPVGAHLEGLKAMGAHIAMEEGYIIAEGKLHGADIVFDKVMVTATENLMMAACLAEGVTTLHNAAMEPEVVDLANCLRCMGAMIEGDGTTTIRIVGKAALHGCEHRVIPDRIEAATYLIAGIMTRGQVTVEQVNPQHLTTVLEKLKQTGAHLTVGPDWVTVDARESRLQAVSFTTAPYPAFPTDVQAQCLAFNTIAEGHSTVTETVFESRFRHTDELIRLGANIHVKGQVAEVQGVSTLIAAPLQATDLRASASLVLAGLVAEGETVIHCAEHIDRGYERIEEKLQKLGANIRREDSVVNQDSLVFVEVTSG